MVALYRHLKRNTFVHDWALPNSRKPIKYFVQLCSYYGQFNYHFIDCDAPLTDLRRKSVPGNIVHSMVAS